MSENCNFCLQEEPTTAVGELMFDIKPGSYTFRDILKKVFLITVSEWETFVCQDCIESTVNLFAFKKRIQNNLLPLCRDNLELITKVFCYIEDNGEANLEVLEHHSCLSLVPASRVNLLRNFIHYTPVVDSGPKSIDTEPEQNDLHNIPHEDCPQFTLILPCSSPKLKKNVKIETEDVPLFSDLPPCTRKTMRRKSRRKNSSKLSAKDAKTEFSKGSSRQDPCIRSSTYPNLRQLSLEEKDWCKEQIKMAKLRNGAEEYQCQQCFKSLKSFSAIRYHLVSRHIIKKEKRNLDKEWVSKKIKEGEIRGRKNKLSWHCVVCFKAFAYHSGLRYHLHQHRVLEKND